jgi:hypothetical protein
LLEEKQNMADKTPNSAPDKAAVDAAFEALKTFDWGGDRKVLRPLEDAVVLAQTDASARYVLENRLRGVLTSRARLAAKDFACRQLSLIATERSIGAMELLLPDKDLSHMARYVLQRIPGPVSASALRDALPKLAGRQQVGVIVSLGARRDVPSVPALTGLLASNDPEVAIAAAKSLGSIGTPEAVRAISDFLPKAPEKLRPIVADACLAGAERLLAAGKKAEALAVYKSLSGADQPKPIRVAATRGMLAVAGKKSED